MRRTAGCMRGCALAVAALFLVITAASIVLRQGDVSSVEIGLLAIAGLVILGVAFFGHSGHWTG